MTIDRDKVAKSALKYIQKGQFQKAIEEYRKVLSADPRDIRTRLKLIDLYARAGKRKEAVDECLHVAESYADQGFYLKAIAVYKQALRVDEANSRLFRNMGELYVKQGLVGDALAAFKRGVDLLRAAGQSGEASQLLLRMEEMAPENSAIKVHLAEMYLADGKMDAFAEEFDKIVLQLRGEGRARKLLQAVEGFYEKSHRHPSVLKRLAELYADLHEDDKALQIVREGLATNPSDRDLRLLALRTHLTLGNLAEARRVALGLFDEAPEDLFILEQLAAIAQARGDRMEETHAHKALAKAYGRQGLPQKEEYHFRKVLELAPDDAEARLALGEVVDSGSPVQAPEIFGLDDLWSEGPAAPVEEGPGALKDGLTEAELYLKYGLEDKAAEKLSQLAEIAPNDLEIRQKLRDLCQRRGDREGWVREQLRIAELLQRQRRESEALRAYQAILEVAPETTEARKAVQYLKPEAAPAPRPSPASIELDGALLEFVGEAGREPSGSRPAAAGAGEVPPDALAEADFYEAQSRNDDAIACLLRLRQQYPESADIDARLRRLGWTEEGGATDEFVDLQAEVLDLAGGALGPRMGSLDDQEASEFDDIVKEFKSGIAEKLDETDFDTHYNLGVAYKEMGLLDEALEEFQRACRSTDRAREAYTSMALVYRDLGRVDDARAALRMALAVPTNSAEDRVAILYELGGLAQEHQDWEGALQAFQKAASLDPSFRDVSKRIQFVQARRAG